MNILMIINGAAYGQDSTYNGVRLAASMAKREQVSLRVFLMGDGVTVAMAGQKTSDGTPDTADSRASVSVAQSWLK